MKEFEFDRNQLSQKLLQDYLEEEKKANRLEEEGAARGRKRLGFRFYLVSFGIAIAVGFFVFAWSTDQFALTSTGVEELPLIRADQTPVKVQPKDPGGLKIANMDKAIYHSLDDKKEELPKVVRILPKPEEPIVRAEITLRPITEVTAKAIVEPITLLESEKEAPKTLGDSEEKASLPQPKANPLLHKEEPEKEVKDMLSALAVNEPVVLAKAVSTIEERTVMVEKPELKKITADDIKAAPTPRRKAELVEPKKEQIAGHRVQLGAFRSMEDLSKTWNKLNDMFPKLFSEKQKFTEKADLGDKGVFYRLQLGPIKDASEGRTICQKLTEKKQGCFFVKQ